MKCPPLRLYISLLQQEDLPATKSHYQSSPFSTLAAAEGFSQTYDLEVVASVTTVITFREDTLKKLT